MILGVEEVTLRRYTQARGSDGRTAMTLSEETTIRASVQPMGDRQREALPEGIRTKVERVMYTRDEVRTADHLEGNPADIVVIDGEELVAVQVKEWRQLIKHYEVALMRRAEEDDV